MAMSKSLVALTHRNFRLIWFGLLASFTGSFMQNAGLLWHVSLLVPPERRGLALGMVGLAKIAPVYAVRGNIDSSASSLPDVLTLDVTYDGKTLRIGKKGAQSTNASAPLSAVMTA